MTEEGTAREHDPRSEQDDAQGDTRQDGTQGPEAAPGSSRGPRFGDGIKQGMGVLAAFKDALEETIQEARERGDLSPERAREVVRDALDRAQNAAEGARERLDFVHQPQIDALREAVDALTVRVASLEAQLIAQAGRTEDAASEPSETE